MKKIKLGILILLTSSLIGCTKELSNISTFSSKYTEVNVIATTDLHGAVSYELVDYVENERKKDKNITVVDAGDFFDFGYEASGDMEKYRDKRRENFENKEDTYIEAPIAKEMKEVGYDAVVFGNHEFISNNRFYLDNLVSDFEKQEINVLSANTYKENDDNYVKPYIIKDIRTPQGNIKLGILGLTIKEVGEGGYMAENGEFIYDKSRDLKDQYGYDGKLYMNDLVKDSKKWVDIMKKEKTDIIVAVVHSGEKPKKPKHPGNRIQELAQDVEGIDAIVAGHTHKEVSQHDYKNKSGKTVIVTQPGAHGESISKINFKLTKKNDKWNITNKYSNLTKIDRYSDIDNFGNFLVKLSSLDNKTKEVSLSEVIPFEWDKAYAFKPNTPREIIYKAAGYKWKNITEAETKDIIQILFMKDKKPVCYVYGKEDRLKTGFNFDESEYKDNTVIILPKKNDKFKVDKESENSITYLTHMN